MITKKLKVDSSIVSESFIRTSLVFQLSKVIEKEIRDVKNTLKLRPYTVISVG